MAELRVTKIKNPDKSGEFLIINATDFNEEEHELFEEGAEPFMAAPDSAPPAKISPATIVGDNEVVLPRTPHPLGLIPPAEDSRPVPPKAKIGDVVGYEAGHEVREAGEAANMVGALDETFGAVPKEEALKVSKPEQEPGAWQAETRIGSESERKEASEEAAKQEEQAAQSQSGEFDPETAERSELFAFLRERDVEIGNRASDETLRERAKEVIEEDKSQSS
jgi:hypothetical protein